MSMSLVTPTVRTGTGCPAIAAAAIVFATVAISGKAGAEPILNPANGHYYEAVVFENEADYPTWDAAKLASESRAFRGVPGYLATITSEAENDFLIANIGPLRSPRGGLWIGATDDPIDGEWRWATGPEAGALFWLGGNSGTQTLFADWAPGEPNNAFGPASESRLGWLETGWNDAPAGGFASVTPGYIVEYSDVPPDDPISTRGPEFVELQIRPDPMFSGRDGYLVAGARGISDIPLSPFYQVASVEFRVADGPWRQMNPLDGSYGETYETALGTVGPFLEPGSYEVCARVTFNGGDTSSPSCVTAHVHSPGTVTMAGAGHITASPAAWPDTCLRDAVGLGATGSGSDLELTVDARRTDATIHQVEGSVTLMVEGLSLESEYLYQMFGEDGRATLSGSGTIRTSTLCGFDGVNADFVVQIADSASSSLGSPDKARVIIRNIFTGATIYDSAFEGLEDLAPTSNVTGDFVLTGR